MSPGAHAFEKDEHGLTSRQVEGESVCLLAWNDLRITSCLGLPSSLPHTMPEPMDLVAT